MPKNKKFILGVQANLWTEYISNPAKAEYMLFPRMTALSDVQWTPQDIKDMMILKSDYPNNWNDMICGK